MFSTPIASRLAQRFADISAQSAATPPSRTTASVSTDPNGDRRTLITSQSPTADDVKTTTVREVVTRIDGEARALPPQYRWTDELVVTAADTSVQRSSHILPSVTTRVESPSRRSSIGPEVFPTNIGGSRQNTWIVRDETVKEWSRQSSPARVVRSPSPEVVGWSGVEEESGRQVCKRGHGLLRISGRPSLPQYSSGWSCDVCTLPMGPHVTGVMHCPECLYDVCPRCQGVVDPVRSAPDSDTHSVTSINGRPKWAYAQNIPGLYDGTELASKHRSVSPDLDVVSVTIASPPRAHQSASQTPQRRSVSFGNAVTAVVDTEGKQPGENRFAPNLSYSPVTYLTRDRLEELQRQRPPALQVPNPALAPPPTHSISGSTVASIIPSQCAKVCRDILGSYFRAKGCTDVNPDSLLEDVPWAMDLYSMATGSTMIRYSSSGAPHERFVFLELFPCEYTKEIVPHVAWAVHAGAARTQGRIPLTNMISVTAGPMAMAFRKHMPTPTMILGPVGANSRRSTHHATYCFSIQFANEKELAFLTPNAMVLHAWTSVLDKLLTTVQAAPPKEGEFKFAQHL